jgi:hypothetical protein
LGACSTVTKDEFEATPESFRRRIGKKHPFTKSLTGDRFSLRRVYDPMLLSEKTSKF